MTNQEFIESIRLEGEEWRDVVGYEGLYMVSSFGRVCTLKETFFHNHPLQYKKIMNQTLAKALGYYRVSLYNKNGKRKYVFVHRIVAEAFLSNSENRRYVDHIDTNRANNHINNLRWVTAKENSNNPLTVTKTKQSRSGMLTSRSRRVAKCSMDGNLLYVYPSLFWASVNANCPYNRMRYIVGYNAKHTLDGFKWMYLSDYEKLVSMSKNSESI